MKLLIDGDAIVFKAASAADGRTWMCSDGQEFKYKKDALEVDKEPILFYNPEPIENACHNAKVLIEAILKEGETEDYIIYLKDKDGENFRRKLFPEYKKHREGKRRPYHEDNVREYILTNHPSELVPGELEVDDMLGIMQDKETFTTCIVSHDKDLFQIPGLHIHIEYNSKLTQKFVEEFDGHKFFYTQCLTGDTSDGIAGVPNIGVKRAEESLRGCKSIESMDGCCKQIFKDAGLSDRDYDTTKRLLWILRQKKDLDTLTKDVFIE